MSGTKVHPTELKMTDAGDDLDTELAEMGIPTTIPDEPSEFGLNHLLSADHIFVNQCVELLEVFTGFEDSNRYKILDGKGEKIYFAAEESGFCNRQCCGSSRPFIMNVLDNSGHLVFKVVRPFRCQCYCLGCLPCSKDQVEMFLPDDTYLGAVRQQYHCCKPVYSVLNDREEVMLNITGPHYCNCRCFNFEFEVMSSDNSRKVGDITKEWSGLTKELFTDADNFGVSFPKELDVRIKSCLIGAVFLIDFMFFEDTTE